METFLPRCGLEIIGLSKQCSQKHFRVFSCAALTPLAALVHPSKYNLLYFQNHNRHDTLCQNSYFPVKLINKMHFREEYNPFPFLILTSVCESEDKTSLNC